MMTISIQHILKDAFNNVLTHFKGIVASALCISIPVIVGLASELRSSVFFYSLILLAAAAYSYYSRGSSLGDFVQFCIKFCLLVLGWAFFIELRFACRIGSYSYENFAGIGRLLSFDLLLMWLGVLFVGYIRQLLENFPESKTVNWRFLFPRRQIFGRQASFFWLIILSFLSVGSFFDTIELLGFPFFKRLLNLSTDMSVAGLLVLIFIFYVFHLFLIYGFLRVVDFEKCSFKELCIFLWRVITLHGLKVIGYTCCIGVAFFAGSLCVLHAYLIVFENLHHSVWLLFSLRGLCLIVEITFALITTVFIVSMYDALKKLFGSLRIKLYSQVYNCV